MFLTILQHTPRGVVMWKIARQALQPSLAG